MDEVQFSRQTVDFCLLHVIHICIELMAQQLIFIVHPIICQIFANTVGLICKLDLAVCHMSRMHLSHVGHIVLPPGGLKSCPENSKPFLKYLSNCHVFCKVHLPLPDGVVTHTGHEVRVLLTKTVASIKLRRDRNERAGLVHLGGKALVLEVFKFVSKKFSKNPRSR